MPPPKKILCLHGAMLSSEILRLQLSPYLFRLEKEQNCSFVFVNAPMETEPEASIVAWYDQPCYRYFHWAPSKTPFRMPQLFAAYDFLYKVIKEQGPFDGFIGFSQGAVTTMALLLHHAETHPEDPPTALFKFGVLFSCPYIPDFDQDGVKVTWGRVKIPTLHIAGETDELWFEGSKRTYEKNCEEGTATLIVHPGGHIVPKDKPTVEKILVAMGKLMDQAMNE